MDRELIENNLRFRERKALYLRYGYDMDAERELILNAAGALGGRILELGTGKGHMSVSLARRGYRFVTLDISGVEQHYARLNLRFFKLESRVNFVLGSGTSLPFRARCLDSVISINTLHHLEQPEPILAELGRVAAPGATLVLSDFSAEGFDLVEQVHRLEGRHHPVEGVTVQAAGESLGWAGFVTRTVRSRFQETLIARRAG